jgi:hypothetical protein
MQIRRYLAVASVVLAAVFAVFAQSTTTDISVLAWLAGGWQLNSGEIRVEEHWTRAAGGTMIGMGRTTGGGKTRSFEYLRIEARADGIYYVAQPNGRPPTDFKAVEVSASRAVFANPKHDFPKRITYRKNADGSMTARVEGDAGGKEQAEEFHYSAIR